MNRPTHPITRTLRQTKNALVSSFAGLLPFARPHAAETPARIVEATLLATGRASSVTDACMSWGRLHPDTFFDHLGALSVADVEGAIGSMNRAVLEAATRRRVLPASCMVAFDLHVDPDYSKRHDGCIGYKDLPGTDWGMAYLSAESVTPPARFTFGAVPIRAATNREDALRDLVMTTKTWVRIELALLDRGFQAAYVFRLFQAENVPFVVPMIRNQKIDRYERDAWRERKPVPGTPYSYHAVPYEVTEQKSHQRQALQVVFFYEPDPKDPSKEVVFVFATNLGDVSPERAVFLATHYRDRWGIETGYREKDRLRVRTASPEYVVRLFLQLVSVVAYDLWTLFRALCVRGTTPALPGPGPPYRLRRFRDDLVGWLTA